jgi:hypothetical protein
MRNEVTIRIEAFVGFLYNKLSTHDDRLTICAVGTAQYINYLVEKGIIYSIERKECNQISIVIIEREFDSEIPNVVKNGLVEIMQEVKTYDYETIGFFVKKVNDTIK